MATRHRSPRTPTAVKRARSLMGNAVRRADRLSIRILEAGKPPSVTKRADLVPGTTRQKKRKAKSSARVTSQVRSKVAQVAPIGLRADVTPKLIKAAPAFGDVLRSIGHAVAVTQTALDETALESLKTLSAQQVEVPVLVEQTLDNNGIPLRVTIKTARVPLTSIVTPSMQQVDQMTFRMDMQVQSFDATSGIKFNQNMASAGVSYSRHSFGFAVAMNNTNVNAQFSNMSDFSSGSVMVSMDIVDRTGFQIPTPLEYGIGANLLVRLKSITQAATTNPVGVNRDVVLTVKLVKASDGSVVPLSTGQYDVTAPPGLLPDTSTAGELKITRFCATGAEPYLEREIYVTFGQLIKKVNFFS